MKKKSKKKPNKNKQKIDVVLASLLNIEGQLRQLIYKVEKLEQQRYYHPQNAEPKKYWPVDYPKYKDTTW